MCLPKDLKGATIQRIVTIVGNILSLNFGLLFGITSVHMRLYIDEQSPLNHIVSAEDASWIYGCLFASAAVGALIGGFLTQRTGTRAVLLLSGLLQILSWFCVHFAYDIVHIYSSRIFGGLAGGSTFAVLPIFIAEIAEEHTSSGLIVTIEQWRTVGVLFGFLLGQHMQYEYVSIVAVCISCAFTLVFPFSQETPYFHMRKGNAPALEKSLRWFRGVRRMSDRNRPDFLRELQDFKSNMEKRVIARANVPQSYLWKVTLITLVLIVGTQLSGIYVIFTCSEEVLANEVFGSLPRDASVVILAFVQFSAATIVVWIVSVLRRKILLFSSALICGCASICLAICIATELRWSFQWFAYGLLLLHTFFANLGMFSLISLIPSEMLPTKLRVTLTSMSWSLSWIIIFALTQYYYNLTSIIGLHGYFVVFGVACICVAMFTLFVMPETRGKTLADMQQMMMLEIGADVSKNYVPDEGKIYLERY